MDIRMETNGGRNIELGDIIKMDDGIYYTVSYYKKKCQYELIGFEDGYTIRYGLGKDTMEDLIDYMATDIVKHYSKYDYELVLKRR